MLRTDGHLDWIGGAHRKQRFREKALIARVQSLVHNIERMFASCSDGTVGEPWTGLDVELPGERGTPRIGNQPNRIATRPTAQRISTGALYAETCEPSAIRASAW
jgi:hypothetical protein